MIKKITFVFLAFLTIACGKKADDGQPPRLVVFICVDQFRFEYLTRFARYFNQEGFNYLIREGGNFVNCQYEHAVTKTSVGHSVMMSGLYPATSGIVANHWYDRDLGRLVYSIEDTTHPVIGLRQKSNRDGRSPVKFQGNNLADLLKIQTNKKARVFGVSNKDVPAILMSGHSADGAYWNDTLQGGFFTSTYYMKTLPPWVQSFNSERSYDRFAGQRWELLMDEKYYPPLDSTVQSHHDYPAGWSGTLPFVIGLNGTQTDSDYYRLLLESPFSSDVLLDFVERLTVEEKLGTDEVPDILCISFSANDAIGHSFGPSSREVMDVTLRTDRYLARLIQFMNKTVGAENVLYVLTSDHGVAPYPEELQKQGIEAGRIKPRDIEKAVDQAMRDKYGNLTREKTYVGRMANLDFYFNRRALEEKKIDKKDAETYISEVLPEAVPQIFQIFRSQDLTHGKINKDKVSGLVLNSYNRLNSGDLMIVLKPNFMWDRNEIGADHGSPYSYDRHVPLIMTGARWIKTGTFGKPCSPADIAPTLAGILGLSTNEGFDGNPLQEGIRFSK